MEQAQLTQRLAEIRTRMEQAAQGRYPVPRILAVTKTHPPEEILPLRQTGLDAIGENRVQEIREKLPFLKDFFQIHLIGQLQSNKVKYIIEDVCLIHSLDRLSLAMEIDRQAGLHGRVMPVLVQVSPAGEPQKGGMPPEEVIPFLRQVRSLPGLHVEGLMAVMPRLSDRARLSEYFAAMRTLFEQVRAEAIDGIEMRELSMGMSGDYDLAAAHGATLVRLGAALLGPRG